MRHHNSKSKSNESFKTLPFEFKHPVLLSIIHLNLKMYFFKGMDYVDQDEDDLDEGPEIEMNWNLATYLPEGGAIQKNFNTVIAGYITANYQFIEEEAQRIAPGHTPIRKRRSSQSQTPNRRLSQATGEIFCTQVIS